MARQNELARNLLAILKDKASLIKAALSIKRTTSSVHVAVIRATTHSPSTSPPAEHHVAAVLSLGNGSRPTACSCVRAVMDRLHNTHDAYVALKCLITLHHIVTRGSFILKDQLSFYPSAGGRNFLNLSRFRDGRDTETWELSSWVRWYASVLECNLVTSRVLATYISSSSSSSTKIDDNTRDGVSITSLLNSDLLREMEALVGMVQEICRAPDSLHFQQNNLVYEVVNLVAGDYRSTQNQILIRLSECGHRVKGLSSGESAELTGCLKRLEDCRERLLALFVNRSRNDAFWDLVSETKMKVVKAEDERERSKRWLVRLGRKEDASESTRFGERVGRPGQQLLRLPYGGECLGGDRVHLAVAPTVA